MSCDDAGPGRRETKLTRRDLEIPLFVTVSQSVKPNLVSDCERRQISRRGTCEHSLSYKGLCGAESKWNCELAGGTTRNCPSHTLLALFPSNDGLLDIVGSAHESFLLVEGAASYLVPSSLAASLYLSFPLCAAGVAREIRGLSPNGANLHPKAVSESLHYISFGLFELKRQRRTREEEKNEEEDNKTKYLSSERHKESNFGTEVLLS